jgi:hypothetical protein
MASNTSGPQILGYTLCQNAVRLGRHSGSKVPQYEPLQQPERKTAFSGRRDRRAAASDSGAGVAA